MIWHILVVPPGGQLAELQRPIKGLQFDVNLSTLMVAFQKWCFLLVCTSYLETRHSHNRPITSQRGPENSLDFTHTHWSNSQTCGKSSPKKLGFPWETQAQLDVNKKKWTFYQVQCASVWSSHLETSSHRWTSLLFHCGLWNRPPKT